MGTTPNFDGCLAATGTVSIDGKTDVQYTYDPAINNVSKRTIQGFSTSAQKKMAECANCPYAMYDKFYKYYGQYDYGNQIVLAAFAGTKTNFRNFNNDFKIYGYDGKEQIIKKATAYIIIWMYVIRELEDALDDCQEACTIENCNDDPVHAWDEAAAFYTGSLEGTDGSGSGKLAYALADKRCGNFKTCGDMADDTGGTSKVNLDILKNLNIGQAKLRLLHPTCQPDSRERPILPPLRRLLKAPTNAWVLTVRWLEDCTMLLPEVTSREPNLLV